jgi:hypothetical protein
MLTGPRPEQGRGRRSEKEMGKRRKGGKDRSRKGSSSWFFGWSRKESNGEESRTGERRESDPMLSSDDDSQLMSVVSYATLVFKRRQLPCASAEPGLAFQGRIRPGSHIDGAALREAGGSLSLLLQQQLVLFVVAMPSRRMGAWVTHGCRVTS